MFFVTSRGAPGMTDNIPSPLIFEGPPFTAYAVDRDIPFHFVILARQ